MNEYINMGIFAAQDLNIVLTDGSDNTILAPANEETYRIAVEGHLCVSGDGALSVFCNDVDGEYEYVNSYGVYAIGGMCVEGAAVYARGGDLDVTESNAWFAILLASAFAIVLIMNSNKKGVFSK